MTTGYVFMWVEKETISSAVRAMSALKFNYVENFVWVKLAVNNRLETEKYTLFNKSKGSLLIFKKEVRNTKERKKDAPTSTFPQSQTQLELRHQRSPDVEFDFCRHDKGLTVDKPQHVYKMIETLLPTAKFDNAVQQFGFLELWAKGNVTREGWVSVVQPLLQ
jgi:hypothetical protein